MALPSQAARPSVQRSMVSSKRRTGLPKRFIAIMVAALVAIGVYALFFRDGGFFARPALESNSQTDVQGDTTDAQVGELPVPEDHEPSERRSAQAAQARTPARTGEAAEPRTPTFAPAQSTASTATNRAAGDRTPVVGRDDNSTFAHGMRMIEAGRVVPGRKLLSVLLFAEEATLSPRQAQTVREELAKVSQRLIFSKAVVDGDSLASYHTVQQGEFLGPIAKKYGVTHEFLAAINGVDPKRIWVGQKLKIVHGPFHAMVRKDDYRMDIYTYDKDGDPIFVQSLPVGLGEDNSTPPGDWQITSKIKDPSWTNPRTHKTYASGDPDNPIGNYWLGLQGVDEATRDKQSYGIHGTIDPESIGDQQSMGCIRLVDADIEQVFNLLVMEKSTVKIRR